MNYFWHIGTQFCIVGIGALGSGLLVGYCGQLSLAHAAFFAIGAYAYALFSLKLALGFVPAVLAACAVAAVSSFAVSIPAKRARGEHLILLTLAVQAVVQGVLSNWVDIDQPVGSLRNLTNGPFGISDVPVPVIFGIRLDLAHIIFVLAVIVLVLALGITLLFVTGPYGRLLRAIRDDELAARGLGKNVDRVRQIAFAIAGILAGTAGVLSAAQSGYVHPALAALDNSILIFAMVAVGGAGTPLGPLVGAAILIGIEEIVRITWLYGIDQSKVRVLAYGLLLTGVVHFRPQGVVGKYRLE